MLSFLATMKIWIFSGARDSQSRGTDVWFAFLSLLLHLSVLCYVRGPVLLRRPVSEKVVLGRFTQLVLLDSGATVAGENSKNAIVAQDDQLHVAQKAKEPLARSSIKSSNLRIKNQSAALAEPGQAGDNKDAHGASGAASKSELLLIKKIEPAYPVMARRMGLQAEVEAELSIAPGGHVLSARVLAILPFSSSGFGFEEAAVAALMQFEFNALASAVAQAERITQHRVRFELLE
jgi:TonB family protein